MTGLERRTARLFANKGKLFVAAFDHPQIYGIMDGLQNVIGQVGKYTDIARKFKVFPVLNLSVSYRLSR